MKTLFDDSYPNIKRFVEEFGYIEIGEDEDSPSDSFIRAINPGGLIWEGKDNYESLDEAFRALEKELDEWI